MSANTDKLDALAKKRDHAADVLGKPLLALSYQKEIDALLATSGNDEVAEIMRLADEYMEHGDGISPQADFDTARNNLEAAVRKALGLTAQTSADQTPATLAVAPKARTP